MTDPDEMYDIEPEQFAVRFPKKWADSIERERLRQLDAAEFLESHLNADSRADQ